MPAVANLDAMLDDMKDDEDAHVVEVYLRQSRGVELVPAGTVIRPSDVENYRPQTPVTAYHGLLLFVLPDSSPNQSSNFALRIQQVTLII